MLQIIIAYYADIKEITMSKAYERFENYVFKSYEERIEFLDKYIELEKQQS